jgi:hypothetical protein
MHWDARHAQYDAWIRQKCMRLLAARDRNSLEIPLSVSDHLNQLFVARENIVHQPPQLHPT